MAIDARESGGGIGEGLLGRGGELVDMGAEHPVAAHGGSDSRGDRAEVLAHHGHAGPGGLEHGDGPKFLGSVGDIGSLGGCHTRGDPPQPVETHHVVDADHGRVAQRVAQGMAIG